MEIKIILSEEKDFPILLFLWHWKIATTAMIGLQIYGSDQSSGNYQRLVRLERAGFIRTRTDCAGRQFTWSLTNRGYKTIHSRLPALREDGYKCENIGHDLMVNAVHLGDWATGLPKFCSVFTEQQLRRVASENYPAWIPNTEHHRPDGYWKIDCGEKSKIVALEVELSPKTNSEYDDTAEFYNSWKRISKVVWVVESPKFATRLKKKFERNCETDASFHNFLTVGQIIDSGWSAKFILGSNKGKTLAEMLHNEARSSGNPLMGKLLLNTSKCPFRMDGYKEMTPSNFHY